MIAYVKRNAIKIIVWLLAFSFLVLFWNIKLEGISRPVSHVPDILDGRIQITVGAVREIVVQGKTTEKPLKISFSIYDEQHEAVYHNVFEQVVLTGNRDTIAQFPKENPLSLATGNYYIEIGVDESDASNMRVWIIEYNGNYKSLYLGLSICILFTLALLLVLVNRPNLKIEWVYAILSVVLGLVFSYVMPPLCAGDEYAHFLESYEVSSRILHTQVWDEQGYTLLRADDYDSAVYLHDAASISDWFETFRKGNVTEFVSAKEKSTVAARSWYVYLPSALMLSIVRLLGGSGHALLLLGRMTNLLVFVALMVLSIRMIPRGKVFLVCLGLVPETLYLANSFSYDGINLALCILLASYFYYLYDTTEKISWKQLLFYLVICAVMIPIKTVYLWYTVLLLLLPVKKLAISRKVIGMALIGVFIAAVGMLVYLWPNISSLAMAGTAPSTGGISEGVSVGYVLSNPREFLIVLGNSLFPELAGFKYPERYLATSFGQILAADRYSGRDLYTMTSWMCATIVLAAAISLCDSEDNPINTTRRLIIGVLGAGMFFGVLLAMYFASTLIVNRKIYGISGRYFLPIYALLPLIVKNRFLTLKFDAKKFCAVIMVLVNLFYYFDVFWHYSYVYFAQPVV